MQVYWHAGKMTYNGEQLTSLWAFRQFGLQGDSIVAFAGPCRVEVEALVDLADARRQAPIYSPAMLHCIVEHFDLDLEKAVLRQRLLINIIKEQIEQAVPGCQLRRTGDDLYQGARKLSVSIATLSPVSSLIHAGINISAAGTPVPAVGLEELGASGTEQLARSIMEAYRDEMQGIYLARCKVRGVR